MTLPLVLLALVFSVVGAENCQMEMEAATECFRSEVNNIIKRPTVDTDVLKTDVTKCFTDAGCLDPTEKKAAAVEATEIPASLLSRFTALRESFPPAGPFQMNPKMVEAAQQCGVLLRNSLRPKLLECVRNQEGFENIEWPDTVDAVAASAHEDAELDDGDDKDLPADDIRLSEKRQATKFVRFLMNSGAAMHRRRLYMHQVAMSVYDEEICSTGDARDSAKKCISTVFDRTIPEEAKCLNPIQQEFFIMDKKVGVCNAHKTCKAKMSEKCVKVSEDLPRVTCECSTQTIAENFDELINDMQKCMEEKSGESFTIVRNPLFAGMLKRVSATAMKQICSHLESGMFNPCKILKYNPDEGSTHIHIEQVEIHQYHILSAEQTSAEIGSAKGNLTSSGETAGISAEVSDYKSSEEELIKEAPITEANKEETDDKEEKDIKDTVATN